MSNLCMLTITIWALLFYIFYRMGSIDVNEDQTVEQSLSNGK